MKSQPSEAKIMEAFIDKLCDHLPAERIKLLIDNGFEEWETITYLKGEELIDLGFDTQECIVIMVAANSNALENECQEIFCEEKMQEIMQMAKKRDVERQDDILKEEEEYQKNIEPVKSHSTEPLYSPQQIKEQPTKEITEGLLTKGIFSKAKAGEKVNISKATVISLEEKQITHMTNLEKCPHITNLNLGNNFILKIQNLEQLSKIKMLKLEHNNIIKIEGLESLVNLEYLSFSSNYISRLENLTNNQKLQELYISKQKITGNFTFDEDTTAALAYTLEKFECNQNKVKNITELKNLVVVKDVKLEKNDLEDVGELSETINGMQSLKKLSFKDNPLTKSQKYRDYIVILSKTLEELDGKKILAKEREYLVKLYALKHAKQNNEDKPKIPQKKNGMDLEGTKMSEEFGYHNINRATDLRGIAPYANTKISK